MEKQSKRVPDVECLKYHGTAEKPDIKIFVSHRIDLDSETIDNPLYIPVRCGAVFDEREDVSMLGDDTGDNISEKRNSFCELTVQYWAWKNIEADYYGLYHYRRFLSFSEKYKDNFLWCDNFTDCADQLLLNNPDVMRTVIQRYDFIVAAPCVFQMSLYEQYAKQPELHINDLEKAANIVKTLYPEFTETVGSCLNGSELHLCNLFIMSREVFHKYCAWLFPILSELEKQIDMSNYSLEGLRTIGHISERLLSIYYTFIKENIPRYRTCELQLVFIENVASFQLPKPAFSKDNVPIIFSCSDYFVPFFAQTLLSVLKHTSNTKNYDLCFLHTGITENNQRVLQGMVSDYSNVSLRFLNIERFIRPQNLHVYDRFSVETFYRLLVPQVFSNYSKVIYLDSDLTILRDVAELLEIDIGDNLLAATYDANQISLHITDPEIRKNHNRILQLKNPYLYFQAGVLVFNIREFNKTFRPNELLELAEAREYLYVDQDVLNVACQGRVFPLDMNWDLLKVGSPYVLRQIDETLYEAYIDAEKTPYIVHHAGPFKPWIYPTTNFAAIYWEYARQTPFYEVNILRLAGVQE